MSVWDEEEDTTVPATPAVLQQREDESFWGESDCPICGSQLVLPTGKRDSRGMIVMYEPFETDYIQGLPFTGPYGNLLETELGFQKIRMRDLRRITMWLHRPNGTQECFEYGVQRVIKEAEKRELILLVGAEAVKYFTGLGVDAVSSLVVKSQYLSTPMLVACTSPKSVFSSSVGEIRLALSVFKDKLEECYRE